MPKKTPTWLSEVPVSPWPWVYSEHEVPRYWATGQQKGFQGGWRPASPWPAAAGPGTGSNRSAARSPADGPPLQGSEVPQSLQASIQREKRCLETGSLIK